MSEVLLRDVFPGEVALPDGRVVKGRVFVTTQRILVYQLDPPRRVVLAADIPADTATIPPHHGTMGRGHLTATTDDGSVLINRGAGCACGPLAGMASPVGWR